jgi:hypothetical protein
MSEVVVIACGLGLMTLCALVAVFHTRTLYTELEHNHKDILVELGKPSLLSSKTMLMQLRFTQFILLRRYRRLNNKKISGAGNVILVCGLTNILVFVALCVLLFDHPQCVHFESSIRVFLC